MDGASSYERLRLRFQVFGTSAPVDHGEALYAAISSGQPQLHGLQGFVVSPILQADPAGDELILNAQSHVYVQVPQQHLPVAVNLAGRTFRIRNSYIRLGPPSIQLIQPARTLHSRFVTTKHAETDDVMLAKLQEYLDGVGSHATVQVQRRRVMSIHGKKVVGFGVLLTDVEDDVSVRIQVEGLFGRRRYTAGVFLPAAKTSQ